MLSTIRKIILLLLGLIICSGLFAQEIRYEILKVSRPPVMDGLRDPVWNDVEEIRSFHRILEKDWEKIPDDSLDCAPIFQLLWDDDYLYVYMETYDDILKVDGIGLGIEESIGYNDDCFEIFIDGDYSQGDWDGINDCELWFLYGHDEILTYKSELIPFSIDNIIFEQLKKKDPVGARRDWGVEARFPLADIQVPSLAGTVFGLDLKYSDDDGHELNLNVEGTDREHNLRWSGKNDVHQPSTWNAVQLSDNYIDKAVSFENSPSENGISLYPNPTNGRINVEFKNNISGSCRLQVFEPSGKEVLGLEIFSDGSFIEVLDLTSLPKGIYFYRISGRSKVETGKLLRQ